MAEISASRLQELMQKHGFTQSELARRVGVKQPSIGRLLSGDTRSSSVLVEIARVLQTTPDYLTGQTDDPTEGYVPGPQVDVILSDMGLVPIREVDMPIGMGESHLDQHISATYRYFPRAWLDIYTRSPSKDLIVARGMGESMAPTFLDNDLILIDTKQKIPHLSDQVWAITYCGLGSIKRLRRTSNGEWLLASDNVNISPILTSEDEIYIIGRVVAYFRKI